MRFLTINTLVDAFHYASKLEAKQKGKACFATMPTRRPPDKKAPTDFDKSRSSQPTPPRQDHGKKNSQKDKRECSKQPPTGKWCDYHNSSL